MKRAIKDLFFVGFMMISSSQGLKSSDLFKSSKSINSGEVSGFILGLGASYGSFGFTQYSETQTTIVDNKSTAQGGTTTTTTITPLSTISANGYGVGGGIILGYQGFLEPFREVVQFGVRVYGDLNATKTHIRNEYKLYNPTMLRYGLNIDMIVNFIVVKRVFGLGLFAGVRIGGISYLGKDIDNIDRELHKLNNGNFPKSRFDLGINVGLRANIARNSGVEFIFALPMFELDYKANKERVNKSNGKTTTTINRLRGDFKEQWSVGLRYIWTFD